MNGTGAGTLSTGRHVTTSGGRWHIGRGREAGKSGRGGIGTGVSPSRPRRRVRGRRRGGAPAGRGASWWGDGAHADPDAVRAGLERRPDAAGFGFEDVLSVMGNVIAGPASLARFAAGAPVNTDDRPVVIYDAPRVTYAPDELPRDRLLALLQQLGATPAEVVPEAEPQWQARLAAYWRARDRFIVAGQAVRPSANVQDMLVQVRAPLLDILRESPDFRPAYDPLLLMAAALAPRDRDAAVDVLRALAQVQPERPEAVEGLRALGGR